MGNAGILVLGVAGANGFGMAAANLLGDAWRRSRGPVQDRAKLGVFRSTVGLHHGILQCHQNHQIWALAYTGTLIGY